MRSTRSMAQLTRRVEELERSIRRDRPVVGPGLHSVVGANGTALRLGDRKHTFSFPAIIASQGPAAEADYTDERYWVQRAHRTNAAGDNTIAVALSAYAATDPEAIHVTATNIAESGTHSLPSGTVVTVHTFYDAAVNDQTRMYWFERASPESVASARICYFDSNTTVGNVLFGVHKGIIWDASRIIETADVSVSANGTSLNLLNATATYLVLVTIRVAGRATDLVWSATGVLNKHNPATKAVDEHVTGGWQDEIQIITLIGALDSPSGSQSISVHVTDDSRGGGLSVGPFTVTVIRFQQPTTAPPDIDRKVDPAVVDTVRAFTAASQYRSGPVGNYLGGNVK